MVGCWPPEGIVEPQHKRCETQVEVPTIVVEPPWGERIIPTVCVQWLGHAEVRLPEESQFNFPLQAAHDDASWWGQPEEFRVIFLGQAKDWPRPEMAQRTADAVTDGNLNGWLIWVVSSIVGVRHSSGIGPASFAAPIILLGNPNCGPITPQSYINMRVLEEESAKVNAKNEQ